MITDAGEKWFDENLFKRVLGYYYNGIKMPKSELRWIVPRHWTSAHMSVWGVPCVFADVDRVYLAIAEIPSEKKRDDLYDAFRAGWMKGLDESKNVDELYAEWKKENNEKEEGR